MSMFFSLFGTWVAAPIARNVLLDCIEALDIEPRNIDGEKKYNVGEKKYKTVSDVVGMNVVDAKKNLSDFNLEFSGSGSKVSYQSPNAGERLLEGSTIRLYLTE